MAELLNTTRGVVLSQHVDAATTPWRRTIGLLFARRLAPQRGLWFGRCRAVHTVGMRAPVDILLLDAGGAVVALKPSVEPGRAYVSHPGTRTIVEMGPGFLRDADVSLGDQLILHHPAR